jgi:O-antigen/teichoic acid export membrane protein
MGVGIVAFGSLVTAVFSLWFAAQILGRLPFVPSTASMKKLFVSSVPLGVILLFSLVYFRADSVIITLTRPTAEVGVYGLAYKVFEVILVFPTFFMNAVYPIMLHKKNIENILRNSFLFLLITSFISLVALWFLSPLLVFIKSDFVASVGALRVLTLGLPFFFVTSATMWGLIALKKQKILVSIYGISMAINLIGNIVLIPTHGFMAAAWMTVVGEGVVLFLSSIVLLKTLNNNKEYLKFSIFNF